jgi:hypothetical protein
LSTLASIGGLNKISAEAQLHRRDALWQVAKAGSPVGPLLRDVVETDAASPLFSMDIEERLVADYHGTGLIVGPHAMAYRRSEMRQLGIKSAAAGRSVIMPRVIIDPEEVRRFVGFLQAQSGELRKRKGSIESSFRRLAECWKDEKYRHFENNFEYTSKLLDDFLRKADAYIEYLRKKAYKVDRYLDN